VTRADKVWPSGKAHEVMIQLMKEYKPDDMMAEMEMEKALSKLSLGKRKDPNDINIMVHKDGRKFDLTTGEVVPGTASSTPNYSPRATTPSAPDTTSTTSRRKANLPQINQAPEPTGAPTPAANKSNFTPKPNAERNFTPKPATSTPPTDTGGQDEGTPTKKPDDKGGPSPKQLKDAQKEPGVGDVDPDNKGMQPDIVAENPTKLSMSAENPKNNLLSVDSVERMMDTKVIQMAETVRMQSTNRTGATNQPIVMNNSSTTNSSSSSGGEGNNVSGQNFPLTAINPHIQEFLQKQNMQYQ
jgi:hypothetical protein